MERFRGSQEIGGQVEQLTGLVLDLAVMDPTFLADTLDDVMKSFSSQLFPIF